jgi:hypothetical protein
MSSMTMMIWYFEAIMSGTSIEHTAYFLLPVIPINKESHIADTTVTPPEDGPSQPPKATQYREALRRRVGAGEETRRISSYLRQTQ